MEFMSMRLVALSLLAMTVPASAPAFPREAGRQSDAERLDVALAGLVPGTQVDCIDLRRADHVQGFGNTLVYSVSRKLKYRTQTTGCNGVGRDDDVLVTVTPTHRLCRGDIARTFDQVSQVQTGGCSFGGFTPYMRP